MSKIITDIRILAATRAELDEEVQLDEDLFIITSKKAYAIPDLNVSIRCADFGYKSEDEFEADFSGTLVYELGENDPAKYLYFEQDDPRIALYNYMQALGQAENAKRLIA